MKNLGIAMMMISLMLIGAAIGIGIYTYGNGINFDFRQTVGTVTKRDYTISIYNPNKMEEKVIIDIEGSTTSQELQEEVEE